MYKPYNKKERLGKLVDFTAIQSQNYVPQRQAQQIA